MDFGMFFRQFWALFCKNWVVVSKHKLINILRCFILPVAYGIFLAVAQLFLLKPNNYGLGTPLPVPPLHTAFDSSLSLVWADNTVDSTTPSPTDIMSLVTQGFSPEQRRRIIQLDSGDMVPEACPQNFNLYSECYAAVVFNQLPSYTQMDVPSTPRLTPPPPSLDPFAPPTGTDLVPSTNLVDYTISADAGLGFIDVVRHQSDFEKRILPLQWAIDSAIIQLETNQTRLPPPLEWPFSIETNEEQALRTRLSYNRGLRSLLVIALFIAFLGVPYQLSGSYVTERTAGLTTHLIGVGLKDFPRILSCHVSFSLFYLPAWIITAVLWRYRIFSGTNVGIVLVVHIVTGLSLASSSFLLSLPPISPALSASTTTFLSIIFAIVALVWKGANTTSACVFLLFFPAGFYIFAIRAIAGFEVHQIPTSLVKHDPDSGLILLPLILITVVDIFLHPLLAVWFERRFYYVHDSPSRSRKRSWSRFILGRTTSKPDAEHRSQDPYSPSEDPPAIIISHLSKLYPAPLRRRLSSFLFPFFHHAEEEGVTAITDLSITIPRGGIFVLLGSNGAGKSTVLHILAGLIRSSGGSTSFPPPHGVDDNWRPKLGIVAQKNILFPELTCLQTLRLWGAVKGNGTGSEDLTMLLEECGLAGKEDVLADNLSGGQKRKLGLAIGLVGGSEIVLIDECTSGVDPLSRRAMWKTLTRAKAERTIVFTTHFLDEADLLGDNIAVLAAPGGKLMASGSPVSLKSTLGQGYTIGVTFSENMASQLLERIQNIAPKAVMEDGPGEVVYALKEKNAAVVKKVLEVVEDMEGVEKYDVRGTSIEDIFLGLMHEENDDREKSVDGTSSEETPKLVKLTSGHKKNPLAQSLVIFYKRFLIFRRSPLPLIFAVLLAVSGSCIPLFFLTSRPKNTCLTTFLDTVDTGRAPLYLGDSSYSSLAALFPQGSHALVSPPGLLAGLGASVANVPVVEVPDLQTFTQTVQSQHRNLSLGGLSFDQNTEQALIAWEGTPPGLTAPTLLNLASNVLYNRAMNASGRGSVGPTIIAAGYEKFPALASGTLYGLKWMSFFGATMGAFPAFFALYVAHERKSSVQAMQRSNGLSNPLALWLGHILFDGIFCVILSTLITIIFASVTSGRFSGLGYFWVVMVLHALAAALFAYCVSLFTPSPVAAFAAVAGYEVVMFILYLAGYLLTITFGKNSKAAGTITIIHFTVSLVSPVGNVLRAALVSINLFSLLCTQSFGGTFSPHGLGSMKKFGGPIVYLIGDCLVFLAFLTYFESGFGLPRLLQFGLRRGSKSEAKDGSSSPPPPDVVEEIEATEKSRTDLLRVLHVSKSFKSKKVVNDVTFGVARDTMFALLGPNGAGKTTIFNMIRGTLPSSAGSIHIHDTSSAAETHLSLGVCPQFTAIDPQLTVREHLEIYGLLKGLGKLELQADVDAILKGAKLDGLAERNAAALSGGNGRKLAFACALIGNPPVVLIDEYSTGIDPATKRSMWSTLRHLAREKAIVITTHSMEEASALANKVGILSERMLAIGTTASLANRYPIYEVHFPARTPNERLNAQQLMARVPGAKMADDVATRFEVSIQSQTGEVQDKEGDTTTLRNLSLSQLFSFLSEQENFPEYTVERVGLEGVFLRVVREAGVKEDEDRDASRRWWRIC